VPRHDSAVSTGEIQARPARRPRGIASWPIRRKLVALVTVPLLVVLAAGAVFAITATASYLDARRVRQLSEVAVAAFKLNDALGAEYSATIAVARPPKSTMNQLRSQVDADLAAFEAAVTRLPRGVASERTTQATILFTQAAPSLAGLRDSTDAGRPATQVNAQYGSVLQSLSNVQESITSDINRQATDDTTKTAATALNFLNRGTFAATQERSVLLQGLQEKRLSNLRFLNLLELNATQTLAFDAVAQVATPAQRAQLDQVRAGNPQMDAFRADAPSLVSDSPAGAPAGTATGDPGTFDRVSQARLQTMASLINSASGQLDNGSSTAARNSLIRAIAVAAFALALLLVVGLAVSRIARSIIGPLRLLRVGANDTAHVNLPHAVNQIEETGPEAVVELAPVLPPGTAASPETLDVARAVDNLGAEALRLAAAQVRLRRTLDDAFVSMSRRSQSMVEKQLAIIDELESTEEDPDQLRNLFRLDHLAARMRRYNDNLLVMAGSAMRSRTSGPIRVAELFRAATSEMEQYERVRLQPMGGAAVSGIVAGELIHLLAELLDNAAMYSPPSSSIVLSAAFTSDGGMHMEVVDSGVGIPADEIDRLNARLTHSDPLDLQAHSRIGLFVVARLAARGGFLVSLRQRVDATGTVAQVVVPPESVIGAPGSTAEHAAAAADSLPVPVSGPDGGGVPAVPPMPIPAIPPIPAPGVPSPSLSRDDQVEVDAGSNGPATPIRTVTDSTQLPRRPRPSQTEATPGAGAAAAVAGSAAAAAAMAAAAGEKGGPADRSGKTADVVDGVEAASTAPAEDLFAPQTPVDQPPSTVPPATGARRPSATGWPSTPATPVTANGGTADGDQAASPFSRTGPMSPLGSQTGELKPVSNLSVPAAPPTTGEVAGWDEDLPTELAARAAASAGYRQTDPNAPLIGQPPEPGTGSTPIYDSISAWFAAPARPQIQELPRRDAEPEPVAREEVSVIDIRDGERPQRVEQPQRGEQPQRVEQAQRVEEPQRAEQPQRVEEPVPAAAGTRWGSLGDQRWLAASAQAAAAPEIAGRTDVGLPLRRPGANLVASAEAAAPPGADHGAGASNRDAAAIRGRLGSYQRGLASARRSRPEPVGDEFGNFDPVGVTLFTSGQESTDSESGTKSTEKGGER
jgi:signal transduction histidine kinase